MIIGYGWSHWIMNYEYLRGLRNSLLILEAVVPIELKKNVHMVNCRLRKNLEFKTEID